MKLNRATATATILHMFIIWLLWMSYFSNSKLLVPVIATIMLCIPLVVRETGKLLKECFREEIEAEAMDKLKLRMREYVDKKKSHENSKTK